MNVEKSIRYMPKQTYYTSGTSGVIFRHESTITKYVRIKKSEVYFGEKNPYVISCLTAMKTYALAPQNIPRIYDFGFVSCKCTSTRMYSGTKKDVLDRIDNETCCATVMDFAQNANVDMNYHLLAQAFWLVHCIQMVGMVHGDIFWRNIITSKTDEEFIRCGDLLVPSGGYEFKLVDFDEVTPIGKDKVITTSFDKACILRLCIVCSELIKMQNGQQIGTVLYKDLFKRIKGAPNKLQRTERYIWYSINKPEELQKAMFGKKFVKYIPCEFVIPANEIQDLLMLDTPLECFNYIIKKIKGVKKSTREINAIPFDKGVNGDDVAIKILLLHTNSPRNFAQIKYLFKEGIEYDLPEDAKIQPTKESINETIRILDVYKVIITKFDQSNYIVGKDGQIVLYNLQHVVQSTDTKKCAARKLLSQLAK